MKKEKNKKEKVKKEVVDRKVRKSGRREKQARGRNKSADDLMAEMSGVPKVRFGLRPRLYLSFLIPVVLMICLGVISYQQSFSALQNSYESATVNTVNALNRYLASIMDGIVSKGIQIATSDNATGYVNPKADMAKQGKLGAALKNDLTSYAASDDNIANIHVVGMERNGFSTNGVTGMDSYTSFMENEGGTIPFKNASVGAWMGAHPTLDAKLSHSTDNYICSFVQPIDKSGYVLIDLKKEIITSTLEEQELPEGGILCFCAPDGVQMTSAETEIDFSDEALHMEPEDGSDTASDYVNYKGESYLLICSNIGESGASLISIIPKKTIMNSASQIRTLTIIMVIIGCVIAAILGTLISVGISTTIRSMVKRFRQVESGDFTVEFKTKRKDEFGVLVHSINQTLKGIRNLTKQVLHVSQTVKEAAAEISEQSNYLLEESCEITEAVLQIGENIEQEHSKTEQCLDEMNQLSDGIDSVTACSEQIDSIALTAKENAGSGSVLITQLNDKSKETAAMTDAVIEGVNLLEEKSQAIFSFVEIIKDIASQTNLLALNASIEAVRAGEAGKGFSVVAEEIRKLAEQTVEASGKITTIVKDIQGQTNETALSAQKASQTVLSQETALHETTDTFLQISSQIELLASNLNQVMDSVNSMNTARNDTLQAITSFTEISEHTSESSGKVQSTTERQLDSIRKLTSSADELKENAEELDQMMKQFQI